MVTNNAVNSRNPVIQYVQTAITTRVTCATQMVIDNNIPQKTEGNEVITLAITPTKSTNYLVIKFTGWGSLQAAAAVVALFQDDTSNAIAATSPDGASGAGEEVHSYFLTHKMTAGTTSATTFKIRVGPNAATTLYVNGTSAGNLFGGVASTTLEIWEIKA